MAYCTNTEVKTYLGITGSGDDTFITALIARAQAAIEAYCDRKFEASTLTKTYNSKGSRTLMLDDDLLTITTLTNGDGDAITSDDYLLYPLNDTPKYAIRLKQGSNLFWESDSDGNTEGVISVAGTWGWTATVPADIAHACIRLAGYFYRQKDAQVFDTTAIPDAGVMMIPQGMPKDVKMILDRYVRPRL